jgi:hypothetical protein
MISNIPAVLDRVAARVPRGVTYPRELLARFDPAVPLDREVYNYIVKGGEAGGYYHWLTLLAAQAGPALIVELGSRHGTSTLALYQGLSAGSRLLTVDVMRDQRYIPEKVLHDSRVRFIFGDSLDMTAYERAGVAPPLDIDIFWTDTIHTYRQLSAEFTVYEPLLADEAVIAVDDIHLNDKGRFFQEAPYEKRDLTALCHGSGFGVLHYIRPASERGASPEKRFLEALRRSAKIGYETYWELYRRHEILLATIQKHPVFKIQRKLSAGLGKLFGRKG